MPAPGKWSVRQIAAHLADTELVSAYRFRLMISEENPAIIPFDQEAWAGSLNYAHRSPADSLGDFRYLRLGTCDLLRNLPDTVLQRVGTHSVNGVMTLAQMIEAFAKHAESHVRQIDAARAAYRNSTTT